MIVVLVLGGERRVGNEAGHCKCGVKAGVRGVGINWIDPIAVLDSTNGAELVVEGEWEWCGEKGRGERFWWRRD